MRDSKVIVSYFHFEFYKVLSAEMERFSPYVSEQLFHTQLQCGVQLCLMFPI